MEDLIDQDAESVSIQFDHNAGFIIFIENLSKNLKLVIGLKD